MPGNLRGSLATCWHRPNIGPVTQPITFTFTTAHVRTGFSINGKTSIHFVPRSISKASLMAGNGWKWLKKGGKLFLNMTRLVIKLLNNTTGHSNLSQRVWP